MRYNPGDHPIPGYKLDSFLGAGSYGEVWKAIGPGGVYCALKFIRMDSNSGLKEFRSIKLVKRLQHPNLVPVQGIWLRDSEGSVLSEGTEDSINIRLGGPKELVIAMGLGKMSLAQRLDEWRGKGEKGIPHRELMRYMTDAAKGIDYLNSPEHDLGSGPAAIIHCDIKPANLLIVGGGVQVCDYGVAKAIGADMKKTFAAGTPAYAPPELINNEPCSQTDQYSLAITFYELRTGKLPFDESRAIVANLTGQLDLSAASKKEQEVIKRATHKQPAKRYPTCEEFVEELKAASDYKPSTVIQAGDIYRRTPTPDGSDPSFQLPAPPPPPAPEQPKKNLSDLLRSGEELVPDHFLHRQLGRGGYGEVWEARASGGVRCALKIVRDLQGRGKQEFAVLDKIRELNHQNLVGLRGYWLLATDGTRVQPSKIGTPGVPTPSAVVISTDLAEKNLLDRLKECTQLGHEGIPVVELVGYIRQAAAAIDYLNIKNKIQHRDIKPENLLLREDRLLVSDFGLAKLVEGDGGAVQSSSSGMTLEYAAPELLQKRVSSRTDQYSLALTYYTLRTGRMPFPPGSGQFDTMQARIKGQLDLSGIPPGERDVIRKALSPNVADRYESCELMARELAQACGIGTGQLNVGGEVADIVLSKDIYSSEPTPQQIPPPKPREIPKFLDAGSGPFRGPTQPSTQSGGFLETPKATPPRKKPGAPETPASPAGPTKPAPRGTMVPAWDSEGPHENAPAYPPVAGSTGRASSTISPWGPDVGAEAAPPGDGDPWASEPAASPRSTNTKRTSSTLSPAWSEPKKKSGSTLIAVGLGVVILGGAIAAGAYVASQKGGVTQVTTPSTDPGKPDISEFVAAAEKAILEKQFDAANSSISKIEPLDAGKAKELRDKIQNAKDRLVSIEKKKEKIDELIKGKNFIDARVKLDELSQEDREEVKILNAVFDTAKNAHISDLESQIKRLTVEKKNLEQFNKLYGELKIVEASKDYSLLKAPWDEMASKLPANPLTPIRAQLKQTPPLFEKSLLDLNKILSNMPEPDIKQTAVALQSAWTRAQAANSFFVTGFDSLAKYRSQYLEPVSAEVASNLSEEDRKTLTQFFRLNLAEKIKTAVAGFDEKTKWNELETICKNDAEPTGWVRVAQMEAWAEITAAGEKPQFPLPPEPEATELSRDPLLAGYRKYVSALQSWGSRSVDADTLKAARSITTLLPEVELPAWLNEQRAGNLISLSYFATKASRTKEDRDLLQPFPTTSTSDVTAWLTLADRLSPRAGTKQTERRRNEMKYLRLLAGWSSSKRDLAVLRAIAEELSKPDVLAKLDLLPQQKSQFLAIYAATRPTDLTGRQAAIRSYQEILNLALTRQGGPAQAVSLKFLHREVIAPISDPAFVASFASADQQTKTDAARMFNTAGRHVYRYQSNWLTVPEINTKPDVIAGSLFQNAVELANRSEDRAWVGICRHDPSKADLVNLQKDVTAATSDSSAGKILAALAAGLEARQQKDLKDQLVKYSEADKLYRQTIADCERDSVQWYDELVIAYKRAADNAILLANFDKTSRVKQAEQIDNAVSWAAKLVDLDNTRFDGLDSKGSALEDRAWLLKPADRFDTNGPYKQADTAFAAAQSLGGRAEGWMHQGRNLFKWAEDLYTRRKKGEKLDRVLLNRAEKLMRDALGKLNENEASTTLSECHWWIGRIHMLRYSATVSGEDLGETTAEYYNKACTEYQIALKAAQDIKDWPRYESVWLSLAYAHVYHGYYNKEAVVALEDLYKSEKVRPPTAATRASLDIWRIKIHRYLDNKTKLGFDEINNAVTDGTKGGLTQDRETQVRLQLTLADALASGDFPNAKDMVKALDAAREAVRIAEDNVISVSEPVRAEAYGMLGSIYFWRGSTEAAQNTQWPNARRELTKSLKLDSDHLCAWNWQILLGTILLDDIKGDGIAIKEKAEIGIQVFHLFRQADTGLDRASSQLWSLDRAISNSWPNDRVLLAKTIRTYLEKAVEKSKDSTMRVVWELLIAEIALFELDGNKATEETKKIAKAAASVEIKDTIERIPVPEIQAAGLASWNRVNSRLKSDK